MGTLYGELLKLDAARIVLNELRKRALEEGQAAPSFLADYEKRRDFATNLLGHGMPISGGRKNKPMPPVGSGGEKKESGCGSKKKASLEMDILRALGLGN